MNPDPGAGANAASPDAAAAGGAAPAAPPARSVPLPQLVIELRDLVVTYVRQQTVDPMKSLGRWVGLGLAGSLLMGFGVVFLGMSALRALQTETGDTFTDSWSWVPYVIVTVVLAVGAALVWALRSARADKERVS